MDTTPNLNLPYIAAAQSQKHITHNEAIRALDALVQLAVLSRAVATPPATPVDGARYVVAAGATGAWAGQSHNIAAFQDGAWMFYPVRTGWLVWVEDEADLIVFNGTAWTLAAAASVNPTPLVGVNATADTTNRLAVKSTASLFDNVGNGHQLKLNKATPADTASVLYQDGYSGRAEIGLCGDDNFHFKVSPDGATWKDAIVVNAATGVVTMPVTPAGSYTLPPATATTLGGIKAGANLTVAADGTVSVAAPVTSLAAAAITGLAASATTDTTNAANIGSGTLPAARLPASGVTAGSYGDATHVPQITLGADGRVTAATAVAIAGGSGGATPAGASGQLQYNNAGAFGGTSGLTWTASSQTLTLGTVALVVNGNAAQANVGIGQYNLSSATSTSYGNVALGYAALQHVTTGGSNLGIGGALPALTTANNCVGIGANAGLGITTGGANICIGPYAGKDITTGATNVCIGSDAGWGLTTGQGNVIISANATASSLGIGAGYWNVILGSPSSIPSGTSNGFYVADNYNNWKMSIDANANFALGGLGSPGGGKQTVFIPNTTGAPTTNPVAGGLLYVANGALMYRGSNGTTTTLASA